MKKTNLLLGLFAVLAVIALTTNSAYAQLSFRTWVSAGGNDASDCSRPTPCATFNGALTKTQAGGEINCADAGSYSSTMGAVSINKAITIDCAGTNGVVSHNVSAGIVINAATNDRVILRNLTLDGFGTGTDGIQYNGGTEVEIDNVVFKGGVATSSGIVVNKATAGLLVVRNSFFSKKAIGIKLQTTGGSIAASVSNTSFNNLTNTGIEAGANTYVTVSNSVFTGILGYGIKAATGTSYASATNNVFSSSYIGMSANAAGAKINATGNQFFGNSKAFNVAAGGVFFSGNGNAIDVNPGNPPTGALTYR